jgi:hypothetical protein
MLKLKHVPYQVHQATFSGIQPALLSCSSDGHIKAYPPNVVCLARYVSHSYLTCVVAAWPGGITCLQLHDVCVPLLTFICTCLVRAVVQYGMLLPFRIRPRLHLLSRCHAGWKWMWISEPGTKGGAPSTLCPIHVVIARYQCSRCTKKPE